MQKKRFIEKMLPIKCIDLFWFPILKYVVTYFLLIIFNRFMDIVEFLQKFWKINYMMDKYFF